MLIAAILNTRVIGMSGELKFVPLDDIGINGLNTQSNPTTLEPSWLTIADNILLKESGRITFREGIKQQVLPISGGAPIGAITEYRKDGTILAAVGNKMYEVDFTAPNAAFINPHTNNVATSDWEMIDFNNEIYCVQEGAIPEEYDNGTWTILTSTTGYQAPAGVTTFNPRCGTGYYGRLWVGGIAEEKDVVYYSDLLDAHKWNSGSAGVIDLKTVWGADEIIAIEPFFGQLVIFGRHNIAIYDNPSDPNAASFGLNEVIRGIGCIARDSVQSVGDDLLFLSDTGLRSLSRTTQLDKVPLQEFSLNIRDTLLRNIKQSSNVKSVYVLDDGLFLLSFVDLNITYVFDIRHQTPNNTPRITKWSFQGNRHPSSFTYTDSKGFLIGQTLGCVATLEGYFEEDFVAGGTNTTTPYTSSFNTVWINLGNSAVSSILKKFHAIIEGGSGTTVGLQWFTDFSPRSSPVNSFELRPTTTGTVALFGASSSLYGTSKYAPVFGLEEYTVNLTGRAKFIQFRMTAETTGFVASLQKLILLYKQGKIR